MAGRGVYFALTEEQANRLSEAEGDEQVMEVIEALEEEWDRDWLFETDKAWDALHRILTDGQLLYENGTYPLNLVVIGGELQYEGDDYVVSVIQASALDDIVKALDALTEPDFRERYSQIDPDDYRGEVSEEDFQYTWSSYQGLPDFFRRAAKAERDVVFTVDL